MRIFAINLIASWGVILTDHSTKLGLYSTLSEVYAYDHRLNAFRRYTE